MSDKVILVVDDEEISLEMTCSVLEQAGYKVLKASCAKDALELVELNKMVLSAILMDLIMPGYDGFIAITTIKEQKFLKLIPIMALTSSNDKESVAKAIHAGADDYLTKPFNADELLSRVFTLCKISDFIKRWGVVQTKRSI